MSDNVEHWVEIANYDMETARAMLQIVLDELRDDWLAPAKLHTLARGIDINIEPIILDRSHDSSGLLKHAMETGGVIQP